MCVYVHTGAIPHTGVVGDSGVVSSTVAAVPVMVDQRLLFDVIAAILLAATAAIGAYAPVWISGGTAGKIGQRSMAYSVGNMFSAGGRW